MAESAEAALRDRARRLQALHIGLLFCPATRVRWLADPDAVLAEAGLAPEDRRLIADITAEQFRAEAHGRRILVERNVGRIFERTQKRLSERAAAAPAAGPEPGFDDFLCSDHFLDPKHGLPHNSGAGPGYENVSKYFFWLKDAFALDAPAADIALRTVAYGEFACWLIAEYKRPHDPFYDRFQGGLYWPQTPGEALPVMLMTEAYQLATIGDAETAGKLPRIGLVDLDALAPPVWAPEPPLT